jgi:hypothetical protein
MSGNPCHECAVADNADVIIARLNGRVMELERQRDTAREAADTTKLELLAKHYGASSACDILRKQRDERDVRITELESLLGRIVKYANEDRARTPGFTRLSCALTEASRTLSGKKEGQDERT